MTPRQLAADEIRTNTNLVGMKNPRLPSISHGVVQSGVDMFSKRIPARPNAHVF